jgi:hypothetical protein
LFVSDFSAFYEFHEVNFVYVSLKPPPHGITERMRGNPPTRLKTGLFYLAEREISDPSADRQPKAGGGIL